MVSTGKAKPCCLTGMMMVWQSQTLLPDRNDDGVDSAKPCYLTGMMMVSTVPNLAT